MSSLIGLVLVSGLIITAIIGGLLHELNQERTLREQIAEDNHSMSEQIDELVAERDELDKTIQDGIDIYEEVEKEKDDILRRVANAESRAIAFREGDRVRVNMGRTKFSGRVVAIVPRGQSPDDLLPELIDGKPTVERGKIYRIDETMPSVIVGSEADGCVVLRRPPLNMVSLA